VLQGEAMKKFLIGCLAVVGALLLALTYERLFVERTIGPAAIAGLAFLALLFLMLLSSYLLLGTRHRRVVGNAWLTIFSVTLTYVLVDVVAGWLLIKPLSPPLVPDPHRHHRLVPDSYSQFTQRDFTYVQRVNSLGLRGAERSREKPAGTLRVLMLGDSFTMGKGVEDDQTFSVLVERALGPRLAACGGPGLEVLNGGVDSYAPILSLIELRRDLVPLAPDIVVLNLDVSDLVQEGAYRKIARYTPEGELIGVPQLEPGKASLTDRARNWIERHLYLTRLVFYYANRSFGYRDLSVRDVVTQANFEIAAHTLASDTVNREPQWQAIFESIGQIRDTAAAIPAHFLLTAYPWGHQVNPREWMPGRHTFMPEGVAASDRSIERIRALAGERGIDFLDLFPPFRAYRGEAPLYFRYDNHLTTRGHELMAEGIGNALFDRYLAAHCKAGA
jgi:hypothetical protein